MRNSGAEEVAKVPIRIGPVLLARLDEYDHVSRPGDDASDADTP